MKISDLLIKDRINLDVKSTNKVDIIKELAKLHEKTGVLNDYDGYVKALMTREEQKFNWNWGRNRDSACENRICKKTCTCYG